MLRSKPEVFNFVNFLELFKYCPWLNSKSRGDFVILVSSYNHRISSVRRISLIKLTHYHKVDSISACNLHPNKGLLLVGYELPMIYQY